MEVTTEKLREKQAELEKLAGGERNPPTEKKSDPLPEIINAAKLETMEFPDPVWIVPKILPSGLTILAGKPKLGKSWKALGIAIAVATGGIVWESINVECGRVLYLCLEDSYRRIKDRIRMLMPNESFPKRLDLAREWRRLDKNCIEHLEAYLKANPETKLIVIDTLKMIRSGSERGRNMYDTDYEQMVQLKYLTIRYNICILVIHHTNKRDASDVFDSISGSEGLAGAADTSMVLTRSRNSQDLELHITGRDIEEQSLALRFNGGLFKLLGNAEQFRLNKTCQDIVSLLRDSQEPLSPSSISDELKIKSGNTRKILSGLVNSGNIKKTGRGLYTV